MGRLEQPPQNERWKGLRLAAFCIGIAEYGKGAYESLDNPLKDARAMYEKINEIPGCRAVLLKNPRKQHIYAHLRKDFMEHLAHDPPDVVLLYAAGHGVQLGHDVYIIPSSTELDGGADEIDTKQACVSHLEVWDWFKQLVDEPAVNLRKTVHFLQILDLCRDGDRGAPEHEPIKSMAPVSWSQCFSTSRGCVAQDGEGQSHGPFMKALLHPMRGMFAHNVPLRIGIQNAVDSVAAAGHQKPRWTSALPSDFFLQGPHPMHVASRAELRCLSHSKPGTLLPSSVDLDPALHTMVIVGRCPSFHHAEGGSGIGTSMVQIAGEDDRSEDSGSVQLVRMSLPRTTSDCAAGASSNGQGQETDLISRVHAKLTFDVACGQWMLYNCSRSNSTFHLPANGDGSWCEVSGDGVVLSHSSRLAFADRARALYEFLDLAVSESSNTLEWAEEECVSQDEGGMAEEGDSRGQEDVTKTLMRPERQVAERKPDDLLESLPSQASASSQNGPSSGDKRSRMQLDFSAEHGGEADADVAEGKRQKHRTCDLGLEAYRGQREASGAGEGNAETTGASEIQARDVLTAPTVIDQQTHEAVLHLGRADKESQDSDSEEDPAVKFAKRRQARLMEDLGLSGAAATETGGKEQFDAKSPSSDYMSAEEEQNWSQSKTQVMKTRCPYDGVCYRQNPDHWIKDCFHELQDGPVDARAVADSETGKTQVDQKPDATGYLAAMASPLKAAGAAFRSISGTMVRKGASAALKLLKSDPGTDATHP